MKYISSVEGDTQHFKGKKVVHTHTHTYNKYTITYIKNF